MERRERRQYVPPPWEAGTTPARPEPAELPAEEERPDSSPEPEPAEPSPVVEPSGPAAMRAGRPQAKLDDARVAAMLGQLAIEEPSLTQSAGALSLAAGAFVGLVGLVMSVWGIAALKAVASSGGGMPGFVGAGIVLMFAVLFVVLGVWLLVRGLKQRGDI